MHIYVHHIYSNTMAERLRVKMEVAISDLVDQSFADDVVRHVCGRIDRRFGTMDRQHVHEILKTSLLHKIDISNAWLSDAV